MRNTACSQGHSRTKPNKGNFDGHPESLKDPYLHLRLGNSGRTGRDMENSGRRRVGAATGNGQSGGAALLLYARFRDHMPVI